MDATLVVVGHDRNRFKEMTSQSNAVFGRALLDGWFPGRRKMSDSGNADCRFPEVLCKA